MKIPADADPGSYPAEASVTATVGGKAYDVTDYGTGLVRVDPADVRIGQVTFTPATGDPVERGTLSVDITNNNGALPLQVRAEVTAGLPAGWQAVASPTITVPVNATATATIPIVAPHDRIGDTSANVTVAVTKGGALSGDTTLATRPVLFSLGLKTPPAAPFDYVDFGDATSEQAHAVTGSSSSGTSTEAGYTRRYSNSGVARSWFSVTLRVPRGKPFILRNRETFGAPGTKHYYVIVDNGGEQSVVKEQTDTSTASGARSNVYDILVDEPHVLANTAATGQVTIRYQMADDKVGDPSLADSWVLPADDRQSPDQAASLTGGTIGLNGWFRAAPKVNVQAIDNRTPAPTVRVRDLTPGTPARWQAYAGPLAITGDGGTLTAIGLRWHGNCSPENTMQAYLDNTAPATTATVVRSAGQAAVKLTATDPAQRGRAILYRIDGGAGRSPARTARGQRHRRTHGGVPRHRQGRQLRETEGPPSPSPDRELAPAVAASSASLRRSERSADPHDTTEGRLMPASRVVRRLAAAALCAALTAGVLVSLPGPAPLAVAAAAEPSPATVTGLTVNGRVNPLGISTGSPDFGWQTESDVRGMVQTSYEVRVATSETGLSASPLWTPATGWRRDGGLPYTGPALKSKTRYYWQVRTWDGSKRVTDWSAPAWFETGLIAPADWGGATWIGAQPYSDLARWTDYTADFTFDIDHVGLRGDRAVAMGNDGLMWELSRWPTALPRLREHVRVGRRGYGLLASVDLSSYVTYSQLLNGVHTMSITVDGAAITTRLDGQQVDSRTTSFSKGWVGVRTARPEDTRLASVKVTAKSGETLLSTDFADSNPFGVGKVTYDGLGARGRPRGRVRLSEQGHRLGQRGATVRTWRRDAVAPQGVRDRARQDGRLRAGLRLGTGIYQLGINGRPVGDQASPRDGPTTHSASSPRPTT